MRDDEVDTSRWDRPWRVCLGWADQPCFWKKCLDFGACLNPDQAGPRASSTDGVSVDGV